MRRGWLVLFVLILTRGVARSDDVERSTCARGMTRAMTKAHVVEVPLVEQEGGGVVLANRSGLLRAGVIQIRRRGRAAGELGEVLHAHSLPPATPAEVRAGKVKYVALGVVAYDDVVTIDDGAITDRAAVLTRIGTFLRIGHLEQLRDQPALLRAMLDDINGRLSRATGRKRPMDLSQLFRELTRGHAYEWKYSPGFASERGVCPQPAQGATDIAETQRDVPP